MLNSIKSRGVEDVFIACTNNLTGFDTAINATFPKTEIQNCIIHQLRNSSKYVSYKDLKPLIEDSKAFYTTNVIEGFNRQLRKVTKSKSVFPTDDSLFKMLYLAMIDITKK